MFLGSILLIIGLVFLLKNLGYISESAWSIIWPVILIIIGLRILLKKERGGFYLARQNFCWPFWCPRDKKEFQKKKVDSKKFEKNLGG